MTLHAEYQFCTSLRTSTEEAAKVAYIREDGYCLGASRNAVQIFKPSHFGP